MGIGARIIARRRMIANIDPTHTITLRNAFIADMTRRYRSLANAITVSVRDRDVLGLGPSTRDRINALAATPLPAGAFDSLTSIEKIEQFNIWINQQERQSVLEFLPGPQGPEPYSNQYVRSSYQSGLDKSLRELRAKGINVPSPIIPGAGGVGGIFHAPFHRNRLALIYDTVYTQLEGITEVMNRQIQSVLAQGIAEGIGPEEMARRINNRVDKIGLTRSKLVARTQVVKTYNVAQVNEFQRIENVIGEEILIEWFTAEDERVRSSHRVRHGKVYTKDEYLSLIGEPNCRCTGLPYLRSIDGETELTTATQTLDAEAEQVAKQKAEAAQRRLERQAA